MQDPGGSEGFERGGWALQFNRGPEGDKFKMDELMAADSMLLGRVTYQGFASAWPSRTGDFADKMNNMVKHVVSATLQNPAWSNSKLINGNIPDELRKLKTLPGGDILVAGSGQLLQALMRNHLVDEYRLMIFPVLLGKGKRLFQDGIDKLPLRLVEAKTVGEGVTTMILHPAEKK
jgi:dihydrofolate reductase